MVTNQYGWENELCLRLYMRPKPRGMAWTSNKEHKYIYIDKPVKPVYWSKLSFIVAHFHVESLKVVVNTAKYLVF